MNTRCLDDEEIAIAGQMSAGDPRRKHAEECPRCRARAMVYAEFTEDRSVPAGAKPGEANARLENALAAARAADPARSKQPGLRRGWLRGSRPAPGERTSPGLAPERWRPALVAASAVLAIAAIYAGIGRAPRSPQPDVLRGARPTVATPRLLPAEQDPAGNRILRWRAVPGADAYLVRLFGPDLTDLACLGPRADTLVVLHPATLPATFTGAEVGWQVVALREGREFSSSPPGLVQLR